MLKDSKGVYRPNNSRQVHNVDPKTGAIISTISIPEFCSGDILLEPTPCNDHEIASTREKLQKLNQDSDKDRAEETADHATKALGEKRAEKPGLWRDVLSGLFVAIVAGLFLYYWPSIIAFLGKIFH